MRAALRIAVLVVLALIAAGVWSGGNIVGAVAILLLASIALGVSEGVNRVGQLLEEAKRQSRVLEAQRDHLKNLADVQQQAWQRRNAA